MTMPAEVIPLGTRLRQRRQELGLSQAQAARELDVARTAYRLWEMEAARPAPDRWRVIAKWLGISVSAMLLAAELLSEQEADDADRAQRLGGLSNADWDEEGAATEGDFFAQERATIADQERSGGISAAQAAAMRDMLRRIQGESASDHAATWHAGHFRKRFPATELAPALARAAFATTAVGIPAEQFDVALLLTSELVTNSIEHGDSAWVDLAIVVDERCVRIEVSDSGHGAIRMRASDDSSGWGLTLVGELATRWGVERRPVGKTIWIELDLPA
jgi:transcriptional regulator with XRE-family HTH domain/anti-sigma regulatory factor (Ser/Thr protein kinase)